MKTKLLLVLLPLLCQGLTERICDRQLQDKYCNAPYGGDMHTACRYCGIGLQCPSETPSGRGLGDKDIQQEILSRHNAYRAQVRAMRHMGQRARCIPNLR